MHAALLSRHTLPPLSPHHVLLGGAQVLQMRHAVMLVGQTGGGKSVILSTLARAQSRMGQRTSLSILDPKARLLLRRSTHGSERSSQQCCSTMAKFDEPCGML